MFKVLKEGEELLTKVYLGKELVAKGESSRTLGALVAYLPIRTHCDMFGYYPSYIYVHPGFGPYADTVLSLNRVYEHTFANGQKLGGASQTEVVHVYNLPLRTYRVGMLTCKLRF